MKEFNQECEIDTINKIIEEAQKCEKQLPVSHALGILLRIVNGYINDDYSVLTYIKERLGADIANNLINSILGSFATSLLVTANKMTPEETRAFLEKISSELNELESDNEENDCECEVGKA